MLRRAMFVRKDPARGTSPADARLALGGLLAPAGSVAPLAGILPAPGGSMTVTGAASWNYQVGPGHAVLVRSALDGAMLTTNDGTALVPTTPAPGSGSRWDIVWVRHQDVDAADATSDATFGVLNGVAASTPTKPTGLPPGALALAEVLVPSGATSTAHASVTITQTSRAAAVRGTPIRVRDTVERAVLAPLATLDSPVIINRVNANDNRSFEYSFDGVIWYALAGMPASRVATLNAASGWTGALKASLLPGGVGVIYRGYFAPTASTTITTTLLTLTNGTFPAAYQGDPANAYGGTPLIPVHASGGGVNSPLNAAVAPTGAVQVRTNSGTLVLPSTGRIYIPPVFFEVP